MAYVTGFVAAVPESRKAEYIAFGEEWWPIFKKHGAVAMRDCWGVDVPDGEVTSFPMAVKAEPGETVVLSWLEFPDKATADACFQAMEEGDMGEMQMPFDGKRMIWGGFEDVIDHRT